MACDSRKSSNHFWGWHPQAGLRKVREPADGEIVGPRLVRSGPSNGGQAETGYFSVNMYSCCASRRASGRTRSCSWRGLRIRTVV